MSGFKWDDREIKKLVQKAADDVGKEFQRAMDRLHRTHSGMPVAQVRPLVDRAMRQAGVDAPAATVIEYASMISEGTRIKVEVEKVR